MLRRIELEVLATVERGDTISELATKLDHRESYLSRAIGDLVEKGLVYTERDGRRKRVVPSDARAVELYRDLVRQYSHSDFPELLTGHRYYVYSEDLDAVSPAELCCHTLLIDGGGRHRSYCLFLLRRVAVDEENLREQAAKYGLEDEIDALLRYLEMEGEVNDKRLPE